MTNIMNVQGLEIKLERAELEVVRLELEFKRAQDVLWYEQQAREESIDIASKAAGGV